MHEERRDCRRRSVNALRTRDQNSNHGQDRSIDADRIDDRAHPSKPELHAEGGHDPVLGFFVDVMRGQRVIKSYDHFHPLFNRARPLLGCLDFLVVEQFFTAEQLEDALVYLQDGWPEPIKSVMRVVEIVEAFKANH